MAANSLPSSLHSVNYDTQNQREAANWNKEELVENYISSFVSHHYLQAKIGQNWGKYTIIAYTYL